MNLEIAQQAEELKSTVDELDSLLDTLSNKESANLLEVYKSINIILKSQLCTVKNKPSLRIIRE